MEELGFDNKDGPDQVLPAESFSTVQLDGLVKLRIPETGLPIERQPPISIPTLLQRAARTYPNHPALATKCEETSKWSQMTYGDYYVNVRQCAKAFLKLGLERHHSVCILGFNSAEWFLANFGAIFAGGISAGIYTTNSSEACFHCMNVCQANFCIVENDAQLKKILAVRERLPMLKKIIQYKGTPSNSSILSWQEFMDIGANETDEELNKVQKSLAANECCTLVFTSGTVGQPKAVMLSHDNLIWDALVMIETFGLRMGQEKLVSYLPLSHVAAQVVDMYLAISMASTIYFADRDALKGTLVQTLREVEPTRFLGVPRVYEKIREKMMAIGKESGVVRATIATWAKTHALQHHMDAMTGVERPASWSYIIARSLVFRKIKQALGFSQCLSLVTAAAPLAPEVKEYFMSLDMPLMDAYGMSESSGAHTASTAQAFHINSAGRAMTGVQTRVHKPDSNGHGELWLYGRHIFMGYLDEVERTREALDTDGWLRTGDIGYVDDTGLVYITGRLKEILITAGGENIAPVPIEDLIKRNLPHISNAMIVGERRKFLSVLLTLKVEVDEEGVPSDILTTDTQTWLNELQCPASTTVEVRNRDKVKEAIQKGIDQTNVEAISNAQRIQKFLILPRDFSIATGELGPTMKLKRNEVLRKYAAEIDQMYSVPQ